MTGDLAGVSGQHGITIAANNVTLDLNGFSLTGVAGSLNGIYVSTPSYNVSIYNGGLAGWGGSGVSASNAVASRFADLRLLLNTAEGLIVGSNSLATRCLATANTGSGIRVAGSGNRIEANQSPANGAWGFRVDAAGNLIVNNSAAANASYDYYLATNNSYGLLVQTPAGAITNAPAWANFYTVAAPAPCVPLSSSAACAGVACGDASNGCGGTVVCPNTCPAGEVCNRSACCTPLTKCPAGDNCGSVSDGCGGTLTCGTCTAPQVCSGNVCN